MTTPYEAGWVVQHYNSYGGLGWYVTDPYGEDIAGPFEERDCALAERDLLFHLYNNRGE